MKYIISESQYKRVINEDKGRIEFPGIEYFNDDWGLVEKILNRFTFKGEQYSNIEDLMKAYYIDFIVNWVDPQIDIESDDNDHIAILDDIDLYQSGVDVYNDIIEQWESFDYEELSIPSVVINPPAPFFN
jgi:hypothetical protein